MRWHVTTLAAVWLVVLSWCGSTAQPIDGRLDKAAPAGQHGDERTAPNDGDDLWNLIDESALSESTGNDDFRPTSERIFYVPFKRVAANIDDEPGNLNWPVNPPVRFQSSLLLHAFLSYWCAFMT